MEITYDPEADAVYVSVVGHLRDGEVAETRRVEIPSEVDIDLDADGRILGFEILAASTALPPRTLAQINE